MAVVHSPSHWLRKKIAVGLSLGCLLSATAAIAEPTTNFGSRSLTPGFGIEDGSVAGFTGGSYSFSALSNRDGNGNRCLGYGDSQPDYLLTLEQDFEMLQLQVDSGGADTTLVVEGPNSRFWCGNDIDELNPDAQILGEDFEAGSYSVWVGTMTAGDRQNYTLTIRESGQPDNLEPGK